MLRGLFVTGTDTGVGKNRRFGSAPTSLSGAGAAPVLEADPDGCSAR